MIELRDSKMSLFSLYSCEIIISEPWLKTGDKCEQNACDQINCENNGYCVVQKGVGKCICPVTYSGDRCQCPPVYEKATSSFFGFYSYNWSDAKAYCERTGGLLAFFRNKREYDSFLSSVSHNSDEWIGYYQIYPENNDLYNTVDGEKAIWTKWDSKEPNSKDEQCVEVKRNKGYAMNDLMCSNQRKFTCQKSRNCWILQ